jgi:hypothetical protein
MSGIVNDDVTGTNLTLQHVSVVDDIAYFGPRGQPRLERRLEATARLGSEVCSVCVLSVCVCVY